MIVPTVASLVAFKSEQSTVRELAAVRAKTVPDVSTCDELAAAGQGHRARSRHLSKPCVLIAARAAFGCP